MVGCRNVPEMRASTARSIYRGWINMRKSIFSWVVPEINKFSHCKEPSVTDNPNLFTVRLYCLDAFFGWQPSPLVDSFENTSLSSSSSRKASVCCARETAGASAEGLGGLRMGKLAHRVSWSTGLAFKKLHQQPFPLDVPVAGGVG